MRASMLRVVNPSLGVQPPVYPRFHTMSLPEFIHGRREDIIRDFAAYAKTLMPPGADMTDAELRDHAEEMLKAIVEDMQLRQTPEEAHRKSQGWGSHRSMEASGRLH